MSAAAPQTNGVSSAAAIPSSQDTAPSSSQQPPPASAPGAQPPGAPPASQAQQQQAAGSPSASPATGQNNAQSSQQPNNQQPSQPNQPNRTNGNNNNTNTSATNNNNSRNSATPAPRPRDARTIELLLTAQGVTAFEQRVPLLLLDFAYRHASSVLTDALHLSADPYTSHAGARPTASSGAAPVAPGDAPVSAGAVQLAIASRLGYQFRGGTGGPLGTAYVGAGLSGKPDAAGTAASGAGSGGGAGGSGGGGGAAAAAGGGGGGAGTAVGAGGVTSVGGVSKDWLHDLARERNRIALPRVALSEWGVRLPAEKFVLSGVSWGLKDVWATGPGGDAEESSDAEEDGAEEEDTTDTMMEDAMPRRNSAAGSGTNGEAMEGIEAEDVGGDGVEGGTMDDVFGADPLEDEEMAEE